MRPKDRIETFIFLLAWFLDFTSSGLKNTKLVFLHSEAITDLWKTLYVACLMLERGHLTAFSPCNSVFLAPSSVLAAVIMQLCIK